VNMTPEQEDRYINFRRSVFPAATIRKFVSATVPATLGKTPAMIMAGIAKVYVGELVELGTCTHSARGVRVFDDDSENDHGRVGRERSAAAETRS
jgi:hypothetical protein